MRAKTTIWNDAIKSPPLFPFPSPFDVVTERPEQNGNDDEYGDELLVPESLFPELNHLDLQMEGVWPYGLWQVLL